MGLLSTELWLVKPCRGSLLPPLLILSAADASLSLLSAPRTLTPNGTLVLLGFRLWTLPRGNGPCPPPFWLVSFWCIASLLVQSCVWLYGMFVHVFVKCMG